MKYTEEEVREFIKESNAIEDVWDVESIEESYDSWLWLSEQTGKLTLVDILIAHKGILQRLDPDIAGILRGETGQDVWIGGHKAADPWQVGSKICDWVKRVNDLYPNDWDEGTIKRFHVSFENIHAHVDGNGRIGRLIYCWMRQKANLPIHIIYEKDKNSYYEWFRR